MWVSNGKECVVVPYRIGCFQSRNSLLFHCFVDLRKTGQKSAQEKLDETEKLLDPAMDPVKLVVLLQEANSCLVLT